MVSYPGDLTPDQCARWIAAFKNSADQRWGAERALQMEVTLQRTAVAIGRLEAIEFTPSDHPAFFLSDTPSSQSHGLGDV